MATSWLAVSILKPVFARHRPDWSPTNNDASESESFPSGHATEAFAIATYTALYLHDHSSGNHALAYAGLFTAASLVDVERVYHHRHYVSDVVVGSLLGAATSILIYRYQDGRAKGALSHDLSIGPSVASHASTLSISGTF
jgi:membrane-associated phospholipid phosphatase